MSDARICPNCGSKIKIQTGKIDEIMQHRIRYLKCTKCNFKSKTIEIPLTEYETLMSGEQLKMDI